MSERSQKKIDPAGGILPGVKSEMLYFLWQWKVATAAALHQRFKPSVKGPSFYSMLWRLKRDGLIQMRSAYDPRFIFWVLTKKGFHRVREALPPMKEEGYVSEHLDHDVLVSAIHLGDGVFGPIDGLEFVTEQQLRRLEPHHLPSGIPDCRDRRPDGYWKIETEQGSKLIALEIELHQKANSEYGSMARFYSDMLQIDRALWVTPTVGIAKTIHRMLATETEGVFKHNFVTLGDILTSGWNAEILLGPDQGKSIYALLAKVVHNQRKSLFTTYALDARRTPYFSPCSRLFVPEAFSN